jgi:PAS domain S-box-containing protein
MGLHIATGLKRWVKRAEAKTLHAGRLNIGPRLILSFVFIILSMLAADAVVLWQFHVVRTQAERLNDIDQKLVAVSRVQTSLLAFDDRLDALADFEDADGLVTEAGPLRTAVLEDIRRAMSALSLLPSDLQRDPTIVPTLITIQGALPELESITTLAHSGDWRAVRLRLANQIRPLESLTSALVEKVVYEVGEEQAQTVLNIRRVQRRVFLIVPMTAVFTLLIASILGLAITRSIMQPLERLVEGSKALARGEFQHQVAISGGDELAHLGHVFNHAARRLRDLYATLQSSEDRLRRVIDTIPAHAWSSLPDGSVDFINQRFLEYAGRSLEDLLGWGWGSVVHPDDLTRYVEQWHAAVAAGEPMESQARVRRTDGDYRWLLIRNVPLRDELGNIVNWYGTAIDIEERHRAEDALRRSEAYLAEAQRLSRTGSFGWRVSTGEIFWSEETFRIFQYDKTTKPTLELVLQRVHPEDAALVRQTIDHAEQDGADFDHEYRLRMPNDSVKYVHVVAHAVSDGSSGIEFVGTVMDVTAAKQAEESLRESEAYLAEAQRLSHTGSWAFVPATGEIRYWSKECYRLLGFDPHGGRPRFETIFQRIHPDDQPRVREMTQTAWREKAESELDFRIVHPGGEIRDIHGVGHPVLSPSGDLVEFVGTVIDVTERKRAEEQLRTSEAHLAEAQRLSHTGSWVWRVPGRDALHLSEEWYRIYGFDPEDGMPTWEKRLQRTHPEDRPKWQGTLDRAITQKSDYEVEFRILLPGGSVKYIHTVGHPVLNASGDLVQFVGSSADITERKRAEEALRQAQADLAHVSRMTTMGELTASIAHEVNQPLAAVVTNASASLRWLASQPPNLEEASQALVRIIKEGHRAGEVIARIRALARKAPPQKNWLDISKTILEVLALTRSQVQKNRIALETRLATDLPLILGDRIQLQQVLLNLILNAVEAMSGASESPRQLLVSANKDETKGVLVAVCDSGPELEAASLEKLFEAFYTTKADGLGMGLSISRSIIEAHGGRLWATANDSRGATFQFTLPTNGENV